MLIFGDVLKIGDFGLSGKRGGTSLFASPEQLAMKNVTAKSDIFGLSGVLLFIFSEYKDNVNAANEFQLSFFEDEKELEKALAIAEKESPLLITIKNGFNFSPDDRPELEDIRTAVEKWQKSGKTFIPSTLLKSAKKIKPHFDYENLGR